MSMKGFARRTFKSLEISVSKLAPGGAGWQAFGYMASSQGLASTSAGFALMTGFGDALGVGFGHIIFSALKRPIAIALNKSLNTNFSVPELSKEWQTSCWLSLATMMSGTAWQPVLNFFHGTLDLAFPGCFIGTGIVCGGLFFTGLRVGRNIWPSFGLSAIEKPSADNFVSDMGLSVGIGCAAATFVGTDTSFAWQPLEGMFGVTETMSQTEGIMRAGASTGTGFFTMQTVQNSLLTKISVNASEESQSSYNRIDVGVNTITGNKLEKGNVGN